MAQQPIPDDFFTRHPALAATVITAVIGIAFIYALIASAGH